MMQKHILTFTGLILIYLSALGCKENSALSSIPESNHHYNLDLDSAKQIILPDFLDSIRITKVISQEPILMKWFAGNILKSSKDFIFLKTGTENSIYGIDKANYSVKWKLNLENNSPNFPQSLFDFALRADRKEIYIWDYHKNLFYVYDYTGRYVRNLIPENLPKKHYFDFYNSVNGKGIMFHLQSVPDYDDVYSEEYENKISVYYSFSDNRFSKLMAIPQGSPKRNALFSRFFLPSLDGKLFYYYNMGHEIYQMEPDTIKSIIDLRSDLFLDSAQLKKIDYMDRIKSSRKDEEYINGILRSNKISIIDGFIEKDNYYVLIFSGTPGMFSFLLSKDDADYKFNRSDSKGFVELPGYGCFKTYRLHQMSDGRVFSITDGYHFNDSDVDCTDARIINHPAGEPLSDEDILITEYFFRDEMEFGL